MARAKRQESGRRGPPRTGDRGPNVMCIRTRTAAKISNRCPELLAARAGPLGRDGRVAATQVHAGAGRLVRKRAVGGGNVGRRAADGGVSCVGELLRAPARLRTRLIVGVGFVRNEWGVLRVGPAAKRRAQRCRRRRDFTHPPKKLPHPCRRNAKFYFDTARRRGSIHGCKRFQGHEHMGLHGYENQQRDHTGHRRRRHHWAGVPAWPWALHIY